jgi:hypothetical protein
LFPFDIFSSKDLAECKYLLILIWRVEVATYNGTANNDVIDGTKVAGPSDWIDAGAGNDDVTVGPNQTFVSGPGNDTVRGTNGHGGYGLWFATERPTVDLSQGYAFDGFGGRDTLIGIDTVHLTQMGGTVIGSSAAETVFLFGGTNSLDLGGGDDKVVYHEQQSKDFAISAVTGGLEIRNLKTGTVDLIKGAETIAFADKTVSTAFYTASVKATFQYTAYSFLENTIAPEYTYAGVTYPAGLLSWFPQAVFQLDVDGDGRKDLIIPMEKGYASGLDTRTPFLALTTASGRLVLDAAINAQMPVTAGARRADEVWLASEGREAIVTVAHDTHDGKLADLELLRSGPGSLNANAYIPTLPLALPGRPATVNAHSMATGDLNGDGRTDILIGDWNAEGAYALLQNSNGSFTISRQPLYTALTNNWPMANPNAGEKHNVLVDLALVDVNQDGFDDIVAGWGHGSTHSYVFINNNGQFSADNKIALPDSVYGIDNQLHMKTLIADFDRDGRLDMAILRTRYEPYYGGDYLQILHNDGGGKFSDVTATNVDKPLTDAYADRLQWTDFWQLADVNGDGAMDIVGHRAAGSGAPLLYVNDGAGHFTVTEIALDAEGGKPISWSDFDGDGKLEFVTFHSTWNDAAGTSSTNSFKVFELADVLGTGPGMKNAAELGAPAFNEAYYLNQYADVRALVESGKFATGLAHYLAVGQNEGRQAIAAGSQVQGSAGVDRITLREGNEVAYGKAGDDVINGMDGNDTLDGGAGNDTLDGGAGFDRALYQGAGANFTITHLKDGGFSVADKSGTLGTDRLVGVERVLFSDVAVALDVDGVAGQAFRLYQAAFARTPDLGGLGFWIGAMDKGFALAAVADGFVQSKEFRDVYGASPTNREIVSKFYENVLHRPGDFWSGVLDSKAATVAQVLMGFSESPENQAALVGVTANGIAYTPFA